MEFCNSFDSPNKSEVNNASEGESNEPTKYNRVDSVGELEGEEEEEDTEEIPGELNVEEVVERAGVGEQATEAGKAPIAEAGEADKSESTVTVD